ncbi:MAG: hypothetical protein V3S81_01915 [Anaerolineales bacterium]
MTLDNNLIIGVVLIGAGLLLGLLAYFIITGRSEEEIEEEAENMGEPAKPTPEPEPIELEKEEPSPAPQIEANIPLPDTSEETLPSPPQTPEPPPAEETPPADTTTEPRINKIAQSEPGEASQDRITIATLHRDEVTGELIVQVGDRQYLTAAELKLSSDWNRVEYAASDLTKWISGITIEDPFPEEDREQVTPRPQSMVEQINNILQQKLVESAGSLKGVRLIESSEGTVRVLIGVQSYSIDEVPDTEVRQLIHEAVAAWEEKQ